jgi:hypothetical protein
MVSYATDIKPLFNTRDLNCMKRKGVKLDDYGWMSDPEGNDDYPDHANGRMVFDYVRPDGQVPRMPMGGPYWTDATLTLYQQWMDGGFQA